MATEESKRVSIAPKKPFGQTIRKTNQKIVDTTIGDILGSTMKPAMVLGYIIVSVGLVTAAVGHIERDSIESAIVSYARPTIEAQDAKDGRFIPTYACLRYSMDRGEHITVSGNCTNSLSLALDVRDGINASKEIALSIGDYRIESTFIGADAQKPILSQKVTETYQPIK